MYALGVRAAKPEVRGKTAWTSPPTSLILTILNDQYIAVHDREQLDPSVTHRDYTIGYPCGAMKDQTHIRIIYAHPGPRSPFLATHGRLALDKGRFGDTPAHRTSSDKHWLALPHWTGRSSRSCRKVRRGAARDRFSMLTA